MVGYMWCLSANLGPPYLLFLSLKSEPSKTPLDGQDAHQVLPPQAPKFFSELLEQVNSFRVQQDQRKVKSYFDPKKNYRCHPDNFNKLPFSHLISLQFKLRLIRSNLIHLRASKAAKQIRNARSHPLLRDIETTSTLLSMEMLKMTQLYTNKSYS